MQIPRRRIGFLFLLVYLGFLLEFFLYNFLGSWFKVNFLLLAVIFVTLFWGIRWGLACAFCAGLLKDSYGGGLFGLHFFSFVLCAYLTVLVRQYFYQIESGILRIFLVFLVTISNVLISFTIVSMFYAINFQEAVTSILIPEVVLTTVIAPFLFDQLKEVIARFSIK